LGHLTDHAQDAEFAGFCRALREEVQADADELPALMKGLELSKSVVRVAGGWLAEHATEVKFLLQGVHAAEVGGLQALEALCLGIGGKKALWTALQPAQNLPAAWLGLDLPRLIRRAEEQYKRTEVVRLETARRALR